MMTFAIVLPSPNPSETGERESDANPGVLKKYPPDLFRTGELGVGGLPSTDRIACAKSSRVVCSEQSITVLESPKVLDAIWKESVPYLC